jgi:DNA-binding LytR/AlgR family response regulator
MKSIEEHFSEFENIIRCHKSFFANIYKIEKVSGNSRGYFLHLKHCTESMPVSRGYQKSVMTKIREAKAHLS